MDAPLNICEDGWDSDDGQHTLWGTNYQAQYVGVNDWEKAPVLVLGTDTTAAAETEAPVETEAAPETETAPETEAETVAETEAAPETEPETEAAPETEAETEAPEVVEETVKTEETAPQTFDIGVVAAIAGIVSLAGSSSRKEALNHINLVKQKTAVSRILLRNLRQNFFVLVFYKLVIAASQYFYKLFFACDGEIR